MARLVRIHLSIATFQRDRKLSCNTKHFERKTRRRRGVQKWMAGRGRARAFGPAVTLRLTSLMTALWEVVTIALGLQSSGAHHCWLQRQNPGV